MENPAVVVESKTKPPRVRKTHDPKYFLKYYYEEFALKVPCPHCKKEVTRQKLPRQIRATKSCLSLRAQAELEQSRQQEAPEQPP